MDDVSLHLFCVWVEQKSNKNDVLKNYNTTQHLIGHTKWFSYAILLWTPEIFLASTLTRKTSGPERQHPL